MYHQYSDPHAHTMLFQIKIDIFLQGAVILFSVRVYIKEAQEIWSKKKNIKTNNLLVKHISSIELKVIIEEKYSSYSVSLNQINSLINTLICLNINTSPF